jgi:hypothetical protein
MKKLSASKKAELASVPFADLLKLFCRDKYESFINMYYIYIHLLPYFRHLFISAVSGSDYITSYDFMNNELDSMKKEAVVA